MTAELDALHELLWASSSLLAARIDDDGAIVDASPALREWAQRDVTGTPYDQLVAAPQRDVVRRAIADAGSEWSVLTVGFGDGRERPVQDRTLRLRRDGAAILAVAEADGLQSERLVQEVLELNDDLIAAQRQLGRRQRELERAQADAAQAMERIRRLEAIMLAGLTRPDLQGVLEALLEIARDAFAADIAAVLLRDDDDRHLVMAAAIGISADVRDEVRIPIGRGVAGTIAGTRRGRVVDDLAHAEVWSRYLREGGGSMVGVPLLLEGEMIGVLHVVSRQPGRFDGDDLALLERVGERAALAIGHAQLRERERLVAETLQRSLLPEELPSIGGVTVTSRYISRVRGVHVGGDFYDAVELEGGRLALAIGDVAGKGLDAATMMGRLRTTLRVYATDGAEPAEALERLDRIVCEADGMATALLLVADLATGRMKWANAGHPPPLRVSAAGAGEWLTGALSPPLGTGWEGRSQTDVDLAPGDRLVLYTDGLVERRDVTLDTGLERLLTAATAASGDVDALADHLLSRLAEGVAGFDDDVALLVAELAS